ncbi:hypothetical protein EAF04_010955 [Stromatinia cepivora]|nr:hypothetical protein EAF04_010955 [Stromatinia cepivora]
MWPTFASPPCSITQFAPGAGKRPKNYYSCTNFFTGCPCGDFGDSMDSFKQSVIKLGEEYESSPTPALRVFPSLPTSDKEKWWEGAARHALLSSSDLNVTPDVTKPTSHDQESHEQSCEGARERGSEGASSELRSPAPALQP